MRFVALLKPLLPFGAHIVLLLFFANIAEYWAHDIMLGEASALTDLYDIQTVEYFDPRACFDRSEDTELAQFVGEGFELGCRLKIEMLGEDDVTLFQVPFFVFELLTYLLFGDTAVDTEEFDEYLSLLGYDTRTPDDSFVALL